VVLNMQNHLYDCGGDERYVTQQLVVEEEVCGGRRGERSYLFSVNEHVPRSVTRYMDAPVC
jgi:hypothetical protein